MVTKQDSYGVEAKEFGQNLATIEDKVRVAALGADDTSHAYSFNHLGLGKFHPLRCQDLLHLCLDDGSVNVE